MTDHHPPTWLTEPCPAWCARTHDERDHPDDRFHQSEAVHLEVDGCVDLRLLPLERTMTRLTLIARIGRGAADGSTWIELATEGPPTLTLTLTPTGARDVGAVLLETGTKAEHPPRPVPRA